MANLRGGGEYGKEWHKAGTLMQKQNVFDDFIAGAQFLIDKKYTSSNYLAISGRSNGGLLVGATMTQRPDLMKVALPGVGVLDMLRYHKFTAGAGWAYDYGTSEDNKEMFEYLKKYSPVHNVKSGVSYPVGFKRTQALSSNLIYEPSGRRISFLVLTTTAFATVPFLIFPEGIASLTVITIVSPIEAYLLLEPPKTLMQRTSLAPELSATFNLLSCCIILLSSF